ncbi:CmpA/NrtA family ABC transporter substrate-binding protein [Xanthobacter versatilis]|uniref:CmpA/NrtA family ABC transporter substrate-binding protein n=1 Tax=Xanthobacter autotrophicus (strain ATCC BAA-1158 / Py2) TaxID=78245 RepID=UPI00372A1D63
MTAAYEITAGFIPLLDSALLVAASAKGFAEAENVALTLVRETSWANIRDRIAVGHFQVAHILAPMPIACNLGLTPFASRMIAPMALGLGGNAITASKALWEKMAEFGATSDMEPRSAGAALARVIAARRTHSAPPLRFAVVHPHSAHNYELRYWLAACGIDPEEDVEIVIVPPPMMTAALNDGSIDGYCVGEPWNTAAALSGTGHIATTKAAIWKSSPEKVLGADADWAMANPEALAALLRAIYRAAQWCADVNNHAELAALLAGADYVGTPQEWILPALSGVMGSAGGRTIRVEDFFVPLAKAATFPWKSHALWFYSQMVRWGQVPHTPANQAVARDTYRPDLYRSALLPLGASLPGANMKVEGALREETFVGASGANLLLGPDGFFDDKVFDPERIEAYISDQTSCDQHLGAR